MEAHSSETKLNRAEREYADYMEHGDDFFKIELWRPARRWYKKALELNIDAERIRQKIAECDRLQAFEVKVILRLVAVVAVLILVCYIFRM
jgi:hypothetical protein